MAKVYKGTERVDKFFKHYGVKGMKWKNHTYATDDAPVDTAARAYKDYQNKAKYLQDAREQTFDNLAKAYRANRRAERKKQEAKADAYKNWVKGARDELMKRGDKAYISEQMAKKEEGERRKDEALDAAARKRSIELEEVQPAELGDIDPAATRRYNERKAKEAAASYVSPAAKKRVAEDYVHGVINRRLKQNKQSAENAAKSAAGGAGNTSRIKDEITRLANERAAKEYAGRADHGPGRKTPSSESEARAAAGAYASPAAKKRIATEYEEGLARNERNAKNAAGGAGKAAIDYTERKRAEREAKNVAGGAGNSGKTKNSKNKYKNMLKRHY